MPLALTSLPQYDRDNAQPGMYGSPDGNPANGTGSVVAGRVYFMRFVPSRTLVVASGALAINVAATNDDPSDFGIYDAVTGSLLSHTGNANGRLNQGPGLRADALLSPVVLAPRRPYFSAFVVGTIGGTAASFGVYSLGTSSAATMFVGGAGYTALGSFSGNSYSYEISYQSGQTGGLPSSVPTNFTGWAAAAPVIAWREF